MLKNWFALGNKPKTFEFRCTCCGEVHKGSPSFGFSQPFIYNLIPIEERDDRTFLTDNTCVIDDNYFIRGVLEVPIHGVDDPFLWGFWVSQSEDSFMRYQETFGSDRTGQGSFGWLTVTALAYCRTDLGAEPEHLACDIEWQPKGLRPVIHPQECDHPLFTDYKNGISWERAIEIAQLTMHPDA